MLKDQKTNNAPQRDGSAALKRVRKNVYRQALLAGFMIVLMVVLLFAITAAWYTNIAQTGGLMFEAAKWGFEGSVKVQTGAIEAAPGDEGVIELTAANDGDSVTAVSVNISKAAMEPEQMRQRIYFYVDAAKTRNGEVMERVYLNNTDSYTYTMFSQGSLTLTEEVYNDAQLKWQWVYDVLGYYVLGEWDDANKSMVISDYLRPIEYDYDEAKTTFETFETTGEDGKIVTGFGAMTTIDGTTAAARFLKELSKTDGYPGLIETGPNAGGYYPVEVVTDTEKGTSYGVWAYLCDYSEIQQNTIYDTSLGMGEGQDAEKTYTATITLTAQNSDIETVEVSTGAALEALLKSGGDAVIRLTNDVSLSETLTIGGTRTVEVTDEDGNTTTETVFAMQEVMLELNGKTLTLPAGSYSSKDSGIVVEDGSSLTIVGGSTTQADGTEVTVKGGIQGSGTEGGGYAVVLSGGELTMSGVTITNVDCALSVEDNTSAINADSKIRLVGCDITTTEEAIYLRGNGTDSAQETQLVVENSTITSGYIGIMGNGSDGQWGTDIQILGSTVAGKWAGVYQPQRNSTLTVSSTSEKKSTITGNTGLVVKGGTAIVMGSTVHGTGAYLASDPAFAKSGFTDTGAGIYVETNYGYEIVVEVRDASSITSDVDGRAVLVYDDAANHFKVTIYNAYLSDEPAKAFLADHAVCQSTDEGYAVSPVAAITEDGVAGEAVSVFSFFSERSSAEAEAVEATISDETETESEPQIEETQVTEPETETQTEETQVTEPETETQTEETQVTEPETETQTEETQVTEPETETQTEETQVTEPETETQTEETTN